MALPKPNWLLELENAGAPLTTIDLSSIRTGSGTTGVIPLLPWDHMQGLIAVMDTHLKTLSSVNLHSLRIGDVGLATLVDRILIKDGCTIASLDLRFNAITAAGLRQAMIKISSFNFTLINWLLEENKTSHNDLSVLAGATPSSASESSTSSSPSPAKSRPGPSAVSKKAAEKKEAETAAADIREIETLSFSSIVDKYVREFLKLNADTTACIQGISTQLTLRYLLRHPRLCPTRMAKLLLSLPQVTTITIEGWIPPPPLTLRHQEKKLAKCSPEQIAMKELKRTLPGTLFGSLPKLAELKLVKCVRVDVEKSGKGTLRGIFGKSNKGASPTTKSSFVASIPLEVGAMPSLRRLTMSECGMEEITTGALTYMTQVEQIDFSYNEISAIPPQISALTNITRLFLHNNHIVDIPNELSSMRYLRELWLFDNHITKVPTELARWFPVLKDLRILSQRVEDGLVMEDTQLLEYKEQELDLITTKSSIGCLSFLGLLKLSQTPEIVIYKAPLKKKK